MVNQRNLFSIGLAAILGFGVGSNGLWAAGANSAMASTQSHPPATSAQESQSGALNPVAQSAAQAGVQTCLKRIDQVTNFIGRGAQSNAFVFPAPGVADRRLYTMTLEVDLPNTLSYAGATFAPVGIDACDAEYEAVTYMPMSCQETEAKNFAQLKLLGVVKRSIQMLDGGPNMRVFLMPAGTGCVVIKKEVAY